MDKLLSTKAMIVYVCWFAALVVLERVLPYKQGTGVKLSSGAACLATMLVLLLPAFLPFLCPGSGSKAWNGRVLETRSNKHRD